jgi:hypothetical protein
MISRTQYHDTEIVVIVNVNDRESDVNAHKIYPLTLF